VKIAIMGTGGVGGYYGGLLARCGQEVTFVARGAHYKTIKKSGLQIKSVHGDFTISHAQVTQDPAEIGSVDLVLFCVKTYDTETTAQAIKHIVGPQTVVISLQNGIDAADRIGNIIGPQHIIGGATWISSAIESPGIIKQMSQFRRIVIGELE
jgi:2-dehydropantoate 2-reductase